MELRLVFCVVKNHMFFEYEKSKCLSVCFAVCQYLRRRAVEQLQKHITILHSVGFDILWNVTEYYVLLNKLLLLG